MAQCSGYPILPADGAPLHSVTRRLAIRADENSGWQQRGAPAVTQNHGLHSALSMISLSMGSAGFAFRFESALLSLEVAVHPFRAFQLGPAFLLRRTSRAVSLLVATAIARRRLQNGGVEQRVSGASEKYVTVNARVTRDPEQAEMATTFEVKAR